MLDFNNISAKVAELKALFVIGQRTIPFMEELFVFINETSPLLDEVNRTIEENLAKMPNASKQISKVTQATEMATTEIMDTVDRLNDRLYGIISNFEGLNAIDGQRVNIPLEFLRAIADGIKSGKDLTPVVDDIYLFIERIQLSAQAGYTEIVNSAISQMQAITDDSNTIINALQVQDITAQQLAAVNHLLENIQARLGKIMQHLSPKGDDGTNLSYNEEIKVSKLHREIAFDPDAVDSIMTEEKRQDNVDALFNDQNALANIEKEAGKIANNAVNGGKSNSNANVNAKPANTAFSGGLDGGGDEFSQDDIDALFK